MRPALLTIPLLLIFAVFSVAAQDTVPLEANTPVTVEVSDSAGVVLTYQASGEETVDITARSLTGRLDITLEVFDAEGNLLIFNDDATTTPEGFVATDSQVVGLALPGAGEYTVQIKSFVAGDIGEVEVILTTGGPATTITVPEVSGKALFTSEPLKIYLDGEAPVDLVYTATAAETISIYASTLPENPGGTDPTMEVLDADGEQLAFNDDLTDSTLNPGIEDLELPEAGSYTVRLNTYEDSDPGGVEVSVIGAGSPTVVNEGASLNFDDTLTASIAGEEMLSFVFEGQAGQVITVSIRATEPPSPEQDLVMRLFGPSGQVLAEDDDSGATIDLGERDPAMIDIELPDDGTYRVEVDSLFDVTGEFEITLVEA